MQYTEHYNLKLPESSDLILIEDLNDNTSAIDEALEGMEIGTTAANKIWGVGSVPTNVTIDGALLKLAQNLESAVSDLEEAVPPTMGAAGTVLTAGENGMVWSGTLYHAKCIGEQDISIQGGLGNICTLPTGWNGENLTGLVVRGELQLTGIYNDDDDVSSKEVAMHWGGVWLSPQIEFERTAASGVETLSFTLHLSRVFRRGNTVYVSQTNQETGGVYSVQADVAAALTLSSNGTVTAVTGGVLGFPYSNTSDQKPSAASCTGSVSYYALQAIL